jgi:response regulator RpfG family c-di-GMP phosphodiesterase
MAFEELQRCSGAHFDPAVVEAFSAVFGDVARAPVEA